MMVVICTPAVTFSLLSLPSVIPAGPVATLFPSDSKQCKSNAVLCLSVSLPCGAAPYPCKAYPIQCWALLVPSESGPWLVNAFPLRSCSSIAALSQALLLLCSAFPLRSNVLLFPCEAVLRSSAAVRGYSTAPPCDSPAQLGKSESIPLLRWPCSALSVLSIAFPFQCCALPFQCYARLSRATPIHFAVTPRPHTSKTYLRIRLP